MTGRIGDTLAPWIMRRARTDGDRIALVDGDVRLTFRELAESSRRVAVALKRHGLRAADRVAVVAGPSARLVACVHGVTLAGAVVAPLGPRLTFGELARAIDKIDASLVVVGPDHLESAQQAVSASVSEPKPKILSMDSLFGTGGHELQEVGEPSAPEAIHSIVFTSGTTGDAKAAMLTYENYATSAAATAERLEVDEDDVWLAPMPMHHVGGLSILMRSLQQGFRVVLLSKFDAAETNDVLAAERATVLSVVPAMLHAMLDEHEARFPSVPWCDRFPSLRVVLVGGGPLSEALAERALHVGVPLVTTYGLTETASQVSTSTVAETAEDPTHCGRPIEGLEIRVREPDENGFGTLCVRGPQIFAGYFDDPARTRARFDAGWLLTGDIGRIDERGCVRIAMRRDDLIVTGGENVSPAEVESILCEHPDVVSAGVYPLPDEKWGQRVVAAVVLRPGAAFDAEALALWCRRRMAAFKVPRRFELRSFLPTTAAGKLRRFLLPES